MVIIIPPSYILSIIMHRNPAHSPHPLQSVVVTGFGWRWVELWKLYVCWSDHDQPYPIYPTIPSFDSGHLSRHSAFFFVSLVIRVVHPFHSFVIVSFCMCIEFIVSLHMSTADSCRGFCISSHPIIICSLLEEAYVPVLCIRFLLICRCKPQKKRGQSLCSRCEWSYHVVIMLYVSVNVAVRSDIISYHIISYHIVSYRSCLSLISHFICTCFHG